MLRNDLIISGNNVEVTTVTAAVIGSGAAGYAAALNLFEKGITDLVLVTEGINVGTSRNTGSDKQTYYKLGLCGDYPDSPHAMAEDFFSYGCVDGDHALCEAALSVPCFIKLCELGVPFPTNRYGEFVGYKTDHDPHTRATSAGPLTSKLMTECLEKSVTEKNINIADSELLVSFITDNGKAIGFITLDCKNAADTKSCFKLYNCSNIIMATGGPAGIYKDTVYPLGHTGSSGIAFEAGANGKNLTEWQFGLASVSPRWNVSGTYMQVLPRFVSIDRDGVEHEFLSDYFTDINKLLLMVFKKGYEWPFDSRKVLHGSSIIDILVYIEKNILNRKVYMDFRNNPLKLKNLNYSELEPEAKEYLTNAGACFGTPIERLLHMNTPAYELYLSKGVDLKKEMLEISLCSQHNNGGIDVDLWWQSNIKGLFVIGEAAGTHGIYRPGGSALNAGQVGALRASTYISTYPNTVLELDKYSAIAETALNKIRKFANDVVENESGDTPDNLRMEYTSLMDKYAGAIRNKESLSKLQKKLKETISSLNAKIKIENSSELFSAFKVREMLISQFVFVSAVTEYLSDGGETRGSALYSSESGEKPNGVDDIFRFKLDNGKKNDTVQIVSYKNGSCSADERKVRPIPDGGGFFENVWREYRKNGNVW